MNRALCALFFYLFLGVIVRRWLVLVSIVLVNNAYAAATSDFGTIGLIDTPTARMRADSEFTVAYSHQQVADTYSFNYQAFPWLEASFRYIIQDPSESFGQTAGNRDRSYGLKLRLLEESRYLPNIAIGLQDAVGTGVYGAEYLTATKQVSSNLELSLGLGWGRLADRSISDNPLAEISSSFENRDADTGLGGEASLGDYFSGGKVGLFGGLQYQLPVQNLSFLLEYNSDNYVRESQGGFIDHSSPFSVGLNWKPSSAIELGLSWQHGSELGLTVAASRLTNFRPERPRKLVPNYRLDLMQDKPSALAANRWYEKLAIEVKNNGLKFHAGRLNKDESVVYLEVENAGYMLMAEAVAVVAKMTIPFLPDTVNTVSVAMYETGLYPVTVELPVSLLQQNKLADKTSAAIHRQLKILPGARLQNVDYRNKKQQRKLVFKADIGSAFSLFDPDVPLLYQVFLKTGVSAPLVNGFRLYASKRIDLDNNFDYSTRVSDSVLPHVRSDSIQYLKQGKNGIDQFYVNKYGKLGSQTYYRAFGGILESMFAGVGAEVLHQPYRSRFAYGFSAIAVKQREFEQQFGFIDYETITAHASVYWASPFYNYDAAVHVGRYLAKDMGATFELNRTFSNGWKVGLFATLTDVPFSEFGEGSFDKGFIIRIPLESMTSTKSRSVVGSDIRPISRDGGARLEAYSSHLWNKLRSSNYDSLYDNLNELLR